MKQFKYLFACILLLCSLVFPLFAADNLIRNGDFENLDGPLPSRWEVDTWLKGPEQSRVYVENNNPHSGNNYITIESFTADDGKLVQYVAVSPNTVYKLSCWIKAENIPDTALGANISVLGVVANSQDYKETKGEWKYVEYYGKTGPDQNRLAVAVRLGGYNSINTGKAAFDDVQMIKISRVPSNVKVDSFYAAPQSNNQSSAQQASGSQTQKPGIAATTGNLLLMLILGIFFIVFLFFAYHYLIKPDANFPASENLIEKGFYVALFLAFFLRIILAPVAPGFPNDIACFKGWAGDVANRGIPDFYLGGGFVDYPPGYMYVLYIIGLLQKLFALSYDSPVYLSLIKLPPFLTEILTAFLIFKISRKYLKSMSASAALGLFYAFNPVVIHNSAIFAQIDSVFALFMLLCLMFIDRDNLLLGSLFYTVAVLIKPQALIFAPVGLGVLIYSRNLRVILSSLGVMIGTFIILILPFSVKQFSTNPFWIFNLYSNTLGSYEFATLNAFNLYALLGANWAPLNAPLFFFTFKIWGEIFLALLLAFSLFIYIANWIKQKNRTWPLYLSLFLITAFYMLIYKMHERYLYPAVVLSLLCFVIINDRRFLLVFLGLSLTLFFNQDMILHFAVNYNTFTIPQENALMYILMRVIGGLNIVLLVYLVKIGVDIYLNGKIIPAVKQEKNKVTQSVKV